MLTQQMAKDLGFKGQFQHQMLNPSFLRYNMFWVKGKDHPEIKIKSNQHHHYEYVKVGRTFGIQVTRFLQYAEGLLVYFEDETDTKHQGFCECENLYLCYIDLGERRLFHLSNGTQSSQFFFKSDKFMKQIHPNFFKKVIQLNFSQNYQILETIGKGSFSNVYLTRHKHDNQKYAVKIVSKKDKHGTQTKIIVQEEKKVLSILSSQHIYQFKEFYEDQQSYIFVLEYLQGKQLMNYLKEKDKPFTFQQAHFILKTLLESIRDCHRCNVIHRDLKPQNVILHPKTLCPKLIDFGLSLHYLPNLEKRKFRRCGTMGYMAYEVIQNTADKCKPYDFKCDMFSFGIICHMVLMGYNPLKGKNYEETYLKNTGWKFTIDKEKIIKLYGNDCYQVLASLLDKDPTQRISAEEALHSQFFRKNPELFSKEEDIEENSEEEGQLYLKMKNVKSLQLKATMLSAETKS